MDLGAALGTDRAHCCENVRVLEDELRAERELADRLATHDVLTGLPNRSLLEEHLAMALARARRADQSVALLHIDVDAFKLVNESLGHGGGDRLLNEMAMRVREVTRATDILARPGGDELLLLIGDISGDAVAVVERAASGLVQGLERQFTVDVAEFQVNASMGISIYPRDARDGD